MKSDNLARKHALKQFKDKLRDEFIQKKNINRLTKKLVSFIDANLWDLFYQNYLQKNKVFCLLALGSYGRRELQLHSDVDLLLLHSKNISKKDLQHAQKFIQDCWDIGLEVSHQITTVQDCADLAAQDLTVISTLLDAHLVAGRGDLLHELQYQIHPLHMWSSYDYFFAKKEEQAQRYKKYGETAYNLEPNVKNGPGGLRDIQIILSISKRHFQIKKLAEGIGSGFFTDKEYEELIACQHFLWRVRFALHAIAQKQEERLLFDYQIKLASFFGFQDSEQSLAIEQFMKMYFKIIKRSRELNEMLLQWFEETIVHQQKQKIIALDPYFVLSNNYIEVRNPRVFQQNPKTLLQLFLWIAKKPDIEGVRANTIRLIRQNLYALNEPFYNSQEVSSLFLSIFKAEYPYEALHHMNKYGVLAHYLESFAAVTGQMQYDLFHVYTVDQHTLFVIRNLTRFLQEPYYKQFPLATTLMPKIKWRYILYLAALFHDIGKGRGGDHSEIGAEDAAIFSSRHALPPDESALLIWLVRNHLLMSQTAQRQDIYDLKTIDAFCKKLPEPYYLEYLYLLTLADICATNPALWNAWKDSLLKELYRAASLHLRKSEVDEGALIQSRKEQALELLLQEGLEKARIETLWSSYKEKYFLHEPPTVIAKHTQAILSAKQFPVILIMPHHSQGGTEVFIYMPHRHERFTITTTVLSNHYASIQEASILTCDNHFDLDTYIILNEQSGPIFSENSVEIIRKALEKQLLAETLPQISRRRISRAHAHFKLKPQITFSDEALQKTALFLVTPDRPSLLARVSGIFLNQGIHLHNAKIATAGERAEDMFFISSSKGKALTAEEKERLREALTIELEDLNVG